MKPAHMNQEDASVVPYGTLMSIYLLWKEEIQPAYQVLINGGSGGIGSGVLKLAKHHRAVVTGVCGTQRLGLVELRGADKLIEYTKEDITHNGVIYDLIIYLLGKSFLSQWQDSLKDEGISLLTSFKMRDFADMLRTSSGGGKKAKCAILVAKSEDLALMKEHVEAEKLKAIIDKSFPLEQTADVHRYMETREKKGSVVISTEHRDKPYQSIAAPASKPLPTIDYD